MRDPRKSFVVFADEDRLVMEIFSKAYERAGGPTRAQLRGANSVGGVLYYARSYGTDVRLYVLDAHLTSIERLLDLIAQLHTLSPEARVVVRCCNRPTLPTVVGATPPPEFEVLDKETSAQVLIAKIVTYLAKIDDPYLVAREKPGSEEPVRLSAAV